MSPLKLSELPVELQEKLLTYLNGPNLLQAGRVSILWADLAERIMWKRYAAAIPRNIQIELKEEILGNSDNFSDIYAKWLEADVNTTQPAVKIFQNNVVNRTTCTAMEGNFLFICENNGCITAYPLNESKDKLLAECYRSKIQGGKTRHIAVMKKKDVLIITGDNRVYFHALNPLQEGHTWKELQPNLQIPLACNEVSVFGNHFVVATDKKLLGIFSVEARERDKVTVTSKGNVQMSSWLYLWQLWQDKLLCLLVTGEVCLWDVKKETWMWETAPQLEIRYGNPCWLFRGILFCSTLTSRSLLAEWTMSSEAIEAAALHGAYWHMDRGASYWLIGQSTSSNIQMSRCHLGSHIHLDESGAHLEEDILCVCLKRQLFVCGTHSGKLIIYKLKEDIFEDAMKMKFDMSFPHMIVKVNELPIRYVDIGFHDGRVYVLTQNIQYNVECTMLLTSLSPDQV